MYIIKNNLLEKLEQEIKQEQLSLQKEITIPHFCPCCTTEFEGNPVPKTITVPIQHLPQKIAYKTVTGDQLTCPECGSVFLENETKKTHAPGIIFAAIAVLLAVLILAMLVYVISLLQEPAKKAITALSDAISQAGTNNNNETNADPTAPFLRIVKTASYALMLLLSITGCSISAMGFFKGDKSSVVKGFTTLTMAGILMIVSQLFL